MTITIQPAYDWETSKVSGYVTILTIDNKYIILKFEKCIKEQNNKQQP